MSIADLSFQAEQLAAPDEESQAALIWRRFRRHKLAVIGLIITILLGLFSYVGPFVTPYDSTRIPSGPDYAKARELGRGECYVDQGGVERCHILGTDKSGRDYLTRLMEGGRVSLSLALIVTIVSQILGTIIGSISGYFGGWIDSLIMRIVDFILTLPTLPIFLVIYTLIPMNEIPGGSITVLAFLFIIFGWVGSSRLVRGMVLSLRSQEFTDASRAVGASNTRIIVRHMIPNSLAPVLVAATLGIGGIVVGEAGLSFLGFGVQPPDPSWGNLLQDTQSDIMTAPFRVFYPGMLIFLISLSANFIGDALRDALDPRLKL
ncbi:MAG: ABC transporter permease [Caldilineae bacterium]|nr:ABC transporter permease [Chloroflexota bacterium]MCB9176006.1 ABC transporter permease [Caldilineae bacterium]